MPISTIGANGLNKTEDFTIDGLTVGKGGGNVSNNTVVGLNAGVANTTGKITAVGYLAARFNTTGSGNTAIGGNDGAQDGALYLNTTGNYNIAMGTGAVASNTTGSNNTGIGYSALQNNTTASNNTAVGYQALYSNTTGIQNTAVGTQAGYSITTSNYGCFVGDGAGTSTTGARNTFIGQGAGNAVTSGANNTIIGGYNGNNGGLDIRTASNYIVLSDGDGNPRGVFNNSGYFGVGTVSPVGMIHGESSDNLTIGYFRNNNASNTNDVVQIRAERNTTNGSYRALAYYNGGGGAYRFWVLDSGNVQNTNGSYGSFSDIKLKENIVDATPKLENLCKVKVRNYNLKADQTHKQIGVIAQELEEVFPGLVEDIADKDAEGNDLGTTTKTVKYSVFVPMLIKAVQELNAKVTELEAKLASK